jgi:hypothetical protein
MNISPQLLSEIEQLPREYEQVIFNFVSFLKTQKHPETTAVPIKNDEITIESAYGILKGMGIDANIERDEEMSLN